MEAGGKNLYAFSRNSPQNRVDLFGLIARAGDNCACDQLGKHQWDYDPDQKGGAFIVTHWLYENVGLEELDELISAASLLSSASDFMSIVSDLGLNPGLILDMIGATESELAFWGIEQLVSTLKAKGDVVRLRLKYQCLVCRHKWFGLWGQPVWKEQGRQRQFKCTKGSIGGTLQGVYKRSGLDNAELDCIEEVNAADPESICGD